jgi:hypothetical protein
MNYRIVAQGASEFPQFNTHRGELDWPLTG